MFRVNGRWNPAQDVRDVSQLVAATKDGPQNGDLRCVIGCRRSGKTWALRAVEHALQQEPVLFVDLRDEPLPDLVPKDSVLLLDEPGRCLRDDVEAPAFLQRCAQLRRRHGCRILCAASPCEWELLQRHSRAGAVASKRDSHYLEPLDEKQALRLARTTEAAALLAQLPDAWRRHPFLLELLFVIAESDDDWSKDHVLSQVFDRAQDHEHGYLNNVFERGLSEQQRLLVQDAGWNGLVRSPADAQLLQRCGLLRSDGKRWAIVDPIVAEAFPPSLRIHHLSDVHCGPKTAQTADVKVPGALGQAMGRAVGNQSVRDAYLQHLEQCAATADEAPHLVVVSGDLTERCRAEELSCAVEWLSLVEQHLAPCGLLEGTDPRVLLVGGNHDVRWDLAIPGKNPNERHTAFAEAFGNGRPGWRVPRLDQPSEKRAPCHVRFQRAEIEVLLLGSAEIGGEQEPVVKALEAQRAEAKELEAGGEKPRRIDPGLVHHSTFPRQNDWMMPVLIAVLHHPVSPLPATEVAPFAGLINAGELKDRLLASGFCLVLHGHAHTGWFGVEQWPGRHGGRVLRMAAAPSLGSREVNEHNGFNEIAVRRGLRDGKTVQEIVVRRFVRQGSKWACTEVMGPFEPGQ